MLSIFATISLLLLTETYSEMCCTYKVFKPEWTSSCPTFTDEQSCKFHEVTKGNGAVKEKRNKCRWIDCEDVGYCEWSGKGENGEKYERVCPKLATLPKCIDKMYHKSGMCLWVKGYPPTQWYDLLEADISDLETDEDMEDYMEQILMVENNKLLSTSGDQMVGHSDPYYMYVMMAILILSILTYGVRKSCKVSKGVTDASPLLPKENTSV